MERGNGVVQTEPTRRPVRKLALVQRTESVSGGVAVRSLDQGNFPRPNVGEFSSMVFPFVCEF